MSLHYLKRETIVSWGMGAESPQACLQEVDCVVEIKIVHRAAVEMDLPIKLFAKLLPIPLDNEAQIVVLSPVPAP